MAVEKELIIDTYINYTKKYKELYGEKTVVLMEIGSFYEFYGTSKEGADVKSISELLNIQCTRKDKSVNEISKKNHLLAGFPSYILNKYVDILINENYTVVKCEQVTPPPKPKREITEIISPSLYIDNQSSVNNNFLMSIYFSSGMNKNRDSFLVASLSWVDINTNKSFIFETTEHDSNINLEDVYKTILSNKPSEIVVFTDLHVKKNESLISVLRNFVSTIPISCIHNKLDIVVDDNFFKLSYQNTVFKKIFKNIGLLSYIEYLDLENRPLSITCFCYLLQFCYEHNEKITEGIEKPVFLENDKYLALVNNAIENLNIISKMGNSKSSSLLNLLNNCKTSIGKRYFKQCLIHPLINVDKILERYDNTDFFIKDGLYTETRSYLSKISDLERLFKRLSMRVLQPSEFSLIDESISSSRDMITLLQTQNFELNKIGCTDENTILLDTFINYYQNKFNFEEMSKVNLNQITRNIFKNGAFPEIDNLQDKLVFAETIFEKIVDCLNANSGVNEFKLEINKDNIRSITITKNRFEKLLKDGRRDTINQLLKEKCNLTLEDISSKPFSSTNKTTLKIYFKDMDKYQSSLSELQCELKNAIYNEYMAELEYIKIQFQKLFKHLIKLIEQIDFFCCNAKNAVEKCYVRPVVKHEEESYIKAEKLRHPLIEIIQTDVPYIANDVSIGLENKKGMLLYGLNSVGKSSYMKSIGINLILAQTGLYVAAKSFEFSPYDHVFCRIPSGDNLHKGQSTFVVEINELRTILKRSTSRSLVIGDEIAIGTESVSAISIIASGINYLSKKNASFIFATHLHEVSELECVKNLKNVSINHLSVHFDQKQNCLVFDRILKEGNGETLYGLEIAKSLDLPKDFLYFAEEVRKEYTETQHSIVRPKASTYNKEVFMDKCDICDEETEEIHHITEQQYANSKGILGDKQFHKNVKHNLMNVCSVCHDKIHSDEITIGGYKQTTNGVILEIENKSSIVDNTKLEKAVKELRNKGISYSKILENIKDKFEGENITLYRIKKMLK